MSLESHPTWKPKKAGAAKKKAAPQRKRAADNIVTALMSVPKRKGPGRPSKPSATRLRFIEAFEASYGNVTAACEYAGISRRTYFRWMRSTSRLNQRFQMLVGLIKPTEKMVDLLNAAFISRVQAGSDTLIKFGLERLDPRFAPKCTYEPPTPEQELLAKCVTAFITFLDVRNPSPDDIPMWITTFARNGGVDRQKLEAGVKKKLG